VLLKISVLISVSLKLFVSEYPAVGSIMIRAHSFPQKILLNSAGQVAKFRGLPRQNHPNSTAYHGLSFVSKLSSVLLRNFKFRRPAW